MKTIPESQADSKLLGLYEQLKIGLGVGQVPLFFTYLGAFPEYLEYITDQIVANTTDSGFKKLVSQMGTDISTLTHEMLSHSEKQNDWLSRYRNSPSFYNMKEDLQKIHTTNVTLALLFLALREAVKGWAVAAKQLSPDINTTSGRGVGINHEEKEFVLEGYPFPQAKTSFWQAEGASRIRSWTSQDDNTQSRQTKLTMETTSNLPVKKEASGIEKNLFIDYIRLNQEDFFPQVKQEQYVYLRVYVEKILLASIQLLPHKIISPINVVLELASKYKDFPDLLYLLSEHFPTYAAQRVIFSAYLVYNKK